MYKLFILLNIIIFVFTLGCSSQANKDGALFHAINNRDVDKVTKLIKDGANVNAYMDEFPMIYIAVSEGHKDTVELLITNGANINAQVHYKMGGDTSLHHACARRNIAMIKLLLSKGASTNIKNRVGDTPLSHAKLMKDKEVLEVLIENGATE